MPTIGPEVLSIQGPCCSTAVEVRCRQRAASKRRNQNMCSMHRRILRILMVSAALASWARSADAQTPSASTRVGAGGIGEIHGQLADSASGRAVTSGAVTLRRASDTAFAGGALPKEDGSFHIGGIPPR